MAKARERWPAEVIEEALGREAALVLPRGLRTRSLHASLPLYQIAMLEYLANQKQTSVGHLIAQQLDDVASEHLQQLALVIPDFREAFDWPATDLQEVTC